MGDEAPDDRLDTVLSTLRDCLSLENDRLNRVLATLRDCLSLKIPDENVPPAPGEAYFKAVKAAIEKELDPGIARMKLRVAEDLVCFASEQVHEGYCRQYSNPLPPDFVYANQLGKQMKNEDMINIVQYEDEAVHLPMIVKIMRDALSEPYHVFTYRYFVSDFKDLCYLAIDKRKRECVGAVVARSEEGPNSMFPGYGYIGMLAVDPSMRRTGLGSLLVRKVLDVMREKYKYPGVLLDTEASNEAALNLYAKLGFMKFDFMQRYYMNGGDAHRLLLTFPKPEEALATPPPCSSTSSPDDIPCPPTTSCPDEEGEEIPQKLEDVKCEVSEYLIRKHLHLDPHRPPDYPKPQKLPEVERPPQSPEPVARIPVIVEPKPLSKNQKKKQKRKKKASEMSQESGLGSQGEGGTSQEEVKTEESAEE